MSSNIIITSIILLIFLISLINFRLSLCDSNTRITFLCWNLILFLIIIDLYMIGSKKNIENIINVTEENIIETKSSKVGIIISVIIIIIVLILIGVFLKKRGIF